MQVCLCTPLYGVSEAWYRCAIISCHSLKIGFFLCCCKWFYFQNIISSWPAILCGLFLSTLALLTGNGFHFKVTKWKRMFFLHSFNPTNWQIKLSLEFKLDSLVSTQEWNVFRKSIIYHCKLILGWTVFHCCRCTPNSVFTSFTEGKYCLLFPHFIW